MFLIFSQTVFPCLYFMEINRLFCVPFVCSPKKHNKIQCVRNNVSSLVTAFNNMGQDLLILPKFQAKKVKSNMQISYLHASQIVPGN